MKNPDIPAVAEVFRRARLDPTRDRIIEVAPEIWQQVCDAVCAFRGDPYPLAAPIDRPNFLLYGHPVVAAHSDPLSTPVLAPITKT